MGLKVNLGKTKVKVSGSITKDGMSKSKADPCRVCSLRVEANSVLSVQCGKWMYGRCAGVMRVTPKHSGNPACRTCKGTVGEKQQSIRCCYVMMSNDSKRLYRVSAGRRCDTAVTARTRCGLVKFIKCGQLPHGKRLGEGDRIHFNLVAIRLTPTIHTDQQSR